MTYLCGGANFKLKVANYINKSTILWMMFINLKVRREFNSTKSIQVILELIFT